MNIQDIYSDHSNAEGDKGMHQLRDIIAENMHREKLILRLRRGCLVQTHPTSCFGPLPPLLPNGIPNAH